MNKINIFPNHLNDRLISFEPFIGKRDYSHIHKENEIKYNHSDSSVSSDLTTVSTIRVVYDEKYEELLRISYKAIFEIDVIRFTNNRNYYWKETRKVNVYYNLYLINENGKEDEPFKIHLTRKDENGIFKTFFIDKYERNAIYNFEKQLVKKMLLSFHQTNDEEKKTLYHGSKYFQNDLMNQID